MSQTIIFIYYLQFIYYDIKLLTIIVFFKLLNKMDFYNNNILVFIFKK
jgi:hypothetical protein